MLGLQTKLVMAGEQCYASLLCPGRALFIMRELTVNVIRFCLDFQMHCLDQPHQSWWYDMCHSHSYVSFECVWNATRDN